MESKDVKEFDGRDEERSDTGSCPAGTAKQGIDWTENPEGVGDGENEPEDDPCEGCTACDASCPTGVIPDPDAKNPIASLEDSQSGADEIKSDEELKQVLDQEAVFLEQEKRSGEKSKLEGINVQPQYEEVKIWHTAQITAMMTGYVLGLFRYFCAQRGIRTDHDKDFNVIFYTVYCPTDVYRLKQLRERNPKTLIIAGGIEGFTPAYLLNYADFVCAGEGYTFLKNFPVDKGVKGLAEWCLQQPYLACRSKVGQPLIPNYDIPWDEIPAVQVSQKMYYFMVGRGCRNKCSFCFTSWCNKYATVPPKRLAQLQELAAKGKSIYFVGNDTGEFATLDSTAAQSVSVKRFLQQPHKYEKSQFLHLGIEGWTEKRREWYRKPISAEELRSVLAITKRLTINWEMMMLVHNPMDVDAFVNDLPADIDSYPRVIMKFTHLDAMPYTPLENHDNMLETNFDRDLAFCKVSSKNRRFRSFPVMRLQQEHTNCMLRRATLEQAGFVVDSKKLWSKTLTEWRDFIFAHGMEEAYRGNFVKDFPLVAPYGAACEKVKQKWVVPNDGKV